MEVRGAARHLWRHFEHPETAPLEFGLWGPAGTGKSWDILLFLAWVMHRYPKVPGRIAICRQTHRSLTSSACVTLRKILPHGHPSLDGVADKNRLEYQFGAWTVGLFGLLNPGNLYSTEWDFVYVQEARDISLSSWEQFARGMRNNALYMHDAEGNRVRDDMGNLLHPELESILKVPWCPKILDTNPDTLHSWMLKRAKDRKKAQGRDVFHFHRTYEQDNPAYWDRKNRCRTVMGREFRAQLDTLNGIRLARLRDGVWGSAEGVIWPEFAKATHSIHIPRNAAGWIEPETLKKFGFVEFFAGVDFGIDNAGVMLIGGLTSNGQLIIIHEVFATGKNVDWWAGHFASANKHYPLTLAFCDHNRPDWVRAFNEAIGRAHGTPDAVAVLADKGIDRGLEIVRRRFIENTLKFEADCLAHDPDPVLIERHVPWCTMDCIPEYIRKRHKLADDEDDEGLAREDKPDKSKSNTDGPDALRYLCAGVELIEPTNTLPDIRQLDAREKFRSRYEDLVQDLRGRSAAYLGDDDDDDALADALEQDRAQRQNVVREIYRRLGGRGKRRP